MNLLVRPEESFMVYLLGIQCLDKHNSAATFVVDKFIVELSGAKECITCAFALVNQQTHMKVT